MLAGNPLALVRVGGAVLALPAGGALAAVLALPHPAVHPQAVVSVDLAVPALQHSCGTWLVIFNPNPRCTKVNS